MIAGIRVKNKDKDGVHNPPNNWQQHVGMNPFLSPQRTHRRDRAGEAAA